jgi:hypothetical protein
MVWTGFPYGKGSVCGDVDKVSKRYIFSDLHIHNPVGSVTRVTRYNY